jgi:nucleolar complex protein 3
VPNDRIRGIDDATTTAAGAASKSIGKGKGKGKAEEPKKIKLRDQKTIPVPTSAFERVKKRRRDDEYEEDVSGSGSELGGSSEEDEGDEGDSEEEEDILDMDGDVEDGMDAAFLAGVDRDALSRYVSIRAVPSDQEDGYGQIPLTERGVGPNGEKQEG